MLNNIIYVLVYIVQLLAATIVGCSAAFLVPIICYAFEIHQKELYVKIQPLTEYKRPTFILMVNCFGVYYVIKKIAYSTTICRGVIQKRNCGVKGTEWKLNGRVIAAIPTSKKTSYKNWYKRSNIYIWHYAIIKINKNN